MRANTTMRQISKESSNTRRKGLTRTPTDPGPEMLMVEKSKFSTVGVEPSSTLRAPLVAAYGKLSLGVHAAFFLSKSEGERYPKAECLRLVL